MSGTGALYFGLLRAEVWHVEYKGRLTRVGWLCWFHDGSHWRLSKAEGWRKVWSAYTQEEQTSE